MKKPLFLASFVCNIIIVLFVLTGIVLMFTVGSGILTDSTLSVFKYFTFQSNLFMGVIALLYAFYQFLILRNKRDNMPHVLLVFNHVGVTAVGLTFIIVVMFLAPGYGFDKMYNNANLFFHALAPLLAMLNFMFLEKETGINFKETFLALIPPCLYGIVYFIVVDSLDGYGDLTIDFYGFGARGPGIGALTFFIVMIITYLIGLMLYFVNRLVFKKSKQ